MNDRTLKTIYARLAAGERLFRGSESELAELEALELVKIDQQADGLRVTEFNPAYSSSCFNPYHMMEGIGVSVYTLMLENCRQVAGYSLKAQREALAEGEPSLYIITGHQDRWNEGFMGAARSLEGAKAWVAGSHPDWTLGEWESDFPYTWEVKICNSVPALGSTTYVTIEPDKFVEDHKQSEPATQEGSTS